MPHLKQAIASIGAPALLTNIACTQLFCNHLLDHYSATTKISLGTVQSTFNAMVELYATVHGFSRAEIQAVKRSIQMAGESVAYIDKAPSDADVESAIASGAAYKPLGVHRSGVPPDTPAAGNSVEPV